MHAPQMLHKMTVDVGVDRPDRLGEDDVEMRFGHDAFILLYS